ncbi:MAG: endonuclease/exonuclease/phosphatase family protein [Planctomycetota bacterium]|nr:endonuclease/exonuclease/phosphatase family protein [Planctomycetota bacterium]
MKLVSYNILDGGVGRADPLAEVIQAQAPDVVVLIEADDRAVVDRIAGRLNMDVALAAGHRHQAAILSRWRILESINHALLLGERMSDCFLEATIADPDGTEWTVSAAHLHPRAGDADETRRETEIDAILRTFLDHRDQNKPHLIAGDFNANSPIQEIDPARCKPATRKEMEANGGSVPRRAVQKLLAAGYLDSLHAANGNAARRMGSFSTQYPGQRVDYIFSFGLNPGRFSNAAVEQDRLAKYASDHFPVTLQID